MCRESLPGVGALCSANLVQHLLLESGVEQSSGLRSGPVSAGQTPPMALRNRLLLALSAEEFSRLEPQLEHAPLTVGMQLVEPNTPIEHIYFLEEGKAVIVAVTPQGRRIEAGIIGREGLTGMPVLLGADRTPHECFIQTPGAALRIGADDLRRAMAASASLHQHLLRFAQAFMIGEGLGLLEIGVGMHPA